MNSASERERTAGEREQPGERGGLDLDATRASQQRAPGHDRGPADRARAREAAPPVALGGDGSERTRERVDHDRESEHEPAGVDRDLDHAEIDLDDQHDREREPGDHPEALHPAPRDRGVRDLDRGPLGRRRLGFIRRWATRAARGRRRRRTIGRRRRTIGTPAAGGSAAFAVRARDPAARARGRRSWPRASPRRRRGRFRGRADRASAARARGPGRARGRASRAGAGCGRHITTRRARG